MKKAHLLWTLLAVCLFVPNLLWAKNYVISTAKTSLVLRTEPGKRVDFVYYGSRIDRVNDIYATKSAVNWNAYPVFGTNCRAEHALAVTHANGDLSLELETVKVESYKDEKDGGNVTEFQLRDKVFPFYVKLFYKTYEDSDVIKTWTEYSHKEKSDVVLRKFASAYIPMLANDYWLSYLAGQQNSESDLYEEPINRGRKMLGDHDGTRNAFKTHASFMVSQGRPQENSGNVFGGTLAWSGNYDISFVRDYSHGRLEITAGMNPEMSHYYLKPNEVFTTPEFIFTYSTEGKSGVSRQFHRWARNHQIIDGTKTRDILLNSWEGVRFNVNQAGMDKMIRGISELGGELFVMDDGWFGDKYPRNDGTSSLGDWVLCREKLPNGIDALINSCEERGIKFGIWIEPEMVNSKSELYEKHPDWVVRQPDREPTPGRGGSQLLLDMCNPKVQDFVFKVVDDLLQKHPRIHYIKWDANFSANNVGSYYLPKDRQSHFYIEYHRSLQKVLERIRAKYPKVIIQLCASGGGRLNYGLLPYFHENWTSDNTDALQRLQIQWSVSMFYPSNVIAAHVSRSPSKGANNPSSLKFRFDVAMTGRLGLELRPETFSESEKLFAKRAIETYKGIRDIIQLGDIYRILSPFDKENLYSTQLFATPKKDRAVFFAFCPYYRRNQPAPALKMAGLDPNRNYRIRELNPLDPQKPASINGKVVSGRFLMEQGIVLRWEKGDRQSAVLELTAE